MQGRLASEHSREPSVEPATEPLIRACRLVAINRRHTLSNRTGSAEIKAEMFQLFSWELLRRTAFNNTESDARSGCPCVCQRTAEWITIVAIMVGLENRSQHSTANGREWILLNFLLNILLNILFKSITTRTLAIRTGHPSTLAARTRVAIRNFFFL